MKILFCIANKKAEEYIINEIQKRSNDESNPYGIMEYSSALYRETILQKIAELLPDVVIIKENLEGNADIYDIVKKIRLDYPNTRVIMLISNNQRSELTISQYVSLGIYDVLSGSIDMKHVSNLIFSPNTLKDVEEFIPDTTYADKKNKDESDVKFYVGSRESKVDESVIINKSPEMPNNSLGSIVSVFGKGGCSATALSLADMYAGFNRTLYIEFGNSSSSKRLRFNAPKDLLELNKQGEYYGAITLGSLLVNSHEVYKTYKPNLDYTLNVEYELDYDACIYLFTELRSKYYRIVFDIGNRMSVEDTCFLLSMSSEVYGVVEQDIESIKYLSTYWNHINISKYLLIFDYDKKGYDDVAIEELFKNSTGTYRLTDSRTSLRKCMQKGIFPTIPLPKVFGGV